MCRNIRTLHNFEPPATSEEIHASALQYVRLLRPGDADAFLAGFSDPVVHRNTYGGRLAPTRAAVEAYLARVEGRLDDGEALILAVILREDGSFLGTTLL